MKTLALYDRWAAAFALASGVTLRKVLAAPDAVFVFDDENGGASKALGEWRKGSPLVNARQYAAAARQLQRARYAGT